MGDELRNDTAHDGSRFQCVCPLPEYAERGSGRSGLKRKYTPSLNGNMRGKAIASAEAESYHSLAQFCTASGVRIKGACQWLGGLKLSNMIGPVV